VKKHLISALLFLLLAGSLRSDEFPCLGLTAKSVFVYDITTDRIIYAKAPDAKLPGASTIKLMTALVTLDHYGTMRSARPTKRAFDFPYKKYLKPGVDYSTDDLLRALLLASSNDSANCLAEAIAGNRDNFVNLMHERASELGAADTLFANPSGLPHEKVPQFTTAKDLCRMMREFLRYPRLYGMIKESDNVIRGADGKEVFLQNHNRLLKRYPNVCVGKTGYTRAAKHCFVGYSLVPRKRYIFVILGADRPWQDMSRLLYYAGCISQIVEK